MVFGSDTATQGDFAAMLALSSLNCRNGLRLDGEGSPDDAGGSVSAAGDINGDGFDDLIVGARRAPSRSTAKPAVSVPRTGQPSHQR